MKPLFWSALLQWSRAGLNAVVFLVAARVLTLQEFGTFATAFSIIKLFQGIHKSGIAEAVVIKSATPNRLQALFGISLISGALLSLLYLLAALSFASTQSLYFLGLVPIFLGVSAVSDGLLRKRLEIRTLALRTASAQIIAAAAALSALYYNAGLTALVIYTVSNASLSAILSIFLARWRPKSWSSIPTMSISFRTVLRISGRDILNSGILPLAQIGVGLFIGLSAAGAFQIATRVLSVIDALTLAPLRYLALPTLTSLKQSPMFNTEMKRTLRLTALFACWVWFGIASSSQQVLEMVIGTEHSVEVAPILLALIPLGLSAALAMTFIQALMAQGLTKLVLTKATYTFGLSIFLTFPMFQYSTLHVAIALSLANFAILMWFLKGAVERLEMSADDLQDLFPPALSGVLMFAVISAMNLTLINSIVLGTVIYLSSLVVLNLKMKLKAPA